VANAGVEDSPEDETPQEEKERDTQDGSQEKFKEFISDQKKWKEIQKKFLKERK